MQGSHTRCVAGMAASYLYISICIYFTNLTMTGPSAVRATAT